MRAVCGMKVIILTMEFRMIVAYILDRLGRV
jgi:hypothetical protein